MTDRAFRWATLLAYIAGTAVLAALVVAFCDGHFVYTLDDPYIHLAIAENIARGLYGINAQEYSSPSSSIVFPFLLAPFAALGIERFAPLALGLASNAMSAWIIAGFFHRHVIAGAPGERSWAWLLLVPLLLLSVNAVALPFVGMEHPLHLLAVVLTMTGLVRWGETGRMNAALAVGLIMGPLLRFEGLALSGAVLLILMLKGQRRVALLVGAILTLSFALYALFMHAHGLPLLPSSVLVKSTVSAQAVDHGPMTLAWNLTVNFIGSILIRQGILLLIACIALVPAARGLARRRTDLGTASERVTDTRAMVAFAAIAAMAGHLLLGNYGWFGRYEVYVFAIMMLAVCYALGDKIKQVQPTWRRMAVCAVALALLGPSYAKTTWNTPAAARNIYEQQWQMHRFATQFFPHSVAVNDIGAVAYHNDQFVLDLWGLGSEEARKLRKEALMDAPHLDALVRRRRVPYAMIYDNWFLGSVPASWEPIAHLETSQVVSANTTVTFYLIQPQYKRAMLEALHRFSRTLPGGARLEIVRDTAAGAWRAAPARTGV